MPQRSEGPGTEYPVIRAAVSLLLATLLLIHLPAGAEPKDDAEALRFFLESHYSISVRMGDECRVETSESFQTIITPEGNTAFQ